MAVRQSIRPGVVVDAVSMLDIVGCVRWPVGNTSYEVGECGLSFDYFGCFLEPLYNIYIRIIEISSEFCDNHCFRGRCVFMQIGCGQPCFRVGRRNLRIDDEVYDLSL